MSKVCDDQTASDSFDLPRRIAAFALLVMVGIGAFLRLYRLDAMPLWNDECLQLNGIMMAFKDLRPNHLFGIDHMPPLSYWIQRICWLPFQTHYAARFPGAVAGILMIPVAYFSFRKLLSRFAGLCAAVLTATSFYQVYYSQECRTYIFFGLAIWLFLGLWLHLMSCEDERRAAWWQWVLLSLLGFFCGSFHFATLVFLPTLGVVSSLLLLWDFLRDRSMARFRSVLRTWIGVFLSLIVACGLSYALMRYSMGPKLSGMMEGTKNEWTPPRLSYLYGVFLAFSWGNGWRLLLLLLAMVPAWVMGSRTVRRISTAILLLFVLSFVFAFYLFPQLGFRSTTGAFRYLFWCSWPLIMLPALGIYAAIVRAPRTWRRLAIGAIAVLYVACQVPVFHHYHRMTAKRNNLHELKAKLEAIPGERLFVLCNSYDMHFMQFSWPTNCTFASAPGFNNEVDYKAMGIDKWIEGVASTYPDVILKEGSNIRPKIRETFTNLAPSYGLLLVVSNNASDEILYDLGISPMLGKPMSVVWNSDEDLAVMAAKTKQSIVRFPGSMRLVTTRGGDGRFGLWRLLDRPQVLSVISAVPGADIDVSLRIPEFAQRAELLIETPDGKRQRLELSGGSTSVYDFNRRAWVPQSLSIADAARFQGRLPLQLKSRVVTIRLSGAGSAPVLRLTPIGSPILISTAKVPAS